jgi:hypothetical protein
MATAHGGTRTSDLTVQEDSSRSSSTVVPEDRFVALRPIVDRTALTVAWEVVEAATEDGLGFDPAGFSKCGANTCLACGAAVDDK